MSVVACRTGRGLRLNRAAWLRATVAVVAISALAPAVTTPAFAQNTAAAAVKEFNIPSQPLSGALNVFGRQAGLQVTLASETSRGVSSASVTGEMTPEQALARLLSGTGISYRIQNGTVVVGTATTAGTVGGAAAADGSTVLQPIQVQGVAGGRGGAGEIIIGEREIERNNPTSLADVFRGEPGIQVGSSLPMSQKVYVHGVEETNLAVTIDGGRQGNKVFHHNATTLIDPGLLKLVDVDAGIAPADAGPAALAGAIAYETKDARDLLQGDGVGAFVTSSYNFNSNTFTNGVSGYGMKDGLEFLGYLNYGRGDEFTAGNGDEVLGTSTNIISGIGKVAYEFDSGDRVELSHERVRDDAPRPFRANMELITNARPWEPKVRDYTLTRQNTVFTYTDETPEGLWDPTFVLAYAKNEVGTLGYACPGPGCTIPTTFPTIGETTSFNGKFENRFDVGIGDITAGLDFYNDKVDLDAASTLLGFSDSSREKATNVGLYAQARLEPWDHTRLSFGGRADQQWFTGTSGDKWDNAGLSGNVSLEYDLTDFLTAKTGFSHVWAGIPLAESFIMNPIWNYGDGPEPVTSNNFTFGLEARHNGFTLEGTVFGTDIHDARVARYATATGALLAHDMQSRGFEIGAGYEWLDGFIKVKYAHIDVDVDGKPADSDTGNYLAAPVGDIITITAAHTFSEWGLTIGGDVEIAPEYDRVASGAPAYKAYEVVNVFAEYKPPSHSNLTFRADVKNLFDETYAERASYGQEFGTVKPLYQEGRAFMITAKATF
ncbi:TonB-dependent receptor [Rhizobium sp. RAF36]|uniref:TonB-dependent receptor n=1 Tax=Rhizobium sp. RAF36 TaxID=3233055 RepID=UPI003F9A4842